MTGTQDLPDVEDTIPSTWFKWKDIGELGSTGAFTIQSIETEDGVKPDGTAKVDVHIFFAESDKKWGCNVTNRRTIGALHGTPMAGWIGKRIELQVYKVKNHTTKLMVNGILVGGSIPVDVAEPTQGAAGEPPF